MNLTLQTFRLPFDEDCHSGTAFVTLMGLYKWNTLPMGLSSAPGAFQNLMEFQTSGLPYEMALVWLGRHNRLCQPFLRSPQWSKFCIWKQKDASLKLTCSKGNVFLRKNSFTRTDYNDNRRKVITRENSGR